MDFRPRPVHGSGPIPADVLLCGSEPGWAEVKQGRVFVGPTGEETRRLCELAGLCWSGMFKTNIFRRQPPAKGVPHPAEDWQEGIHELKIELEAVEPHLIIPLGREACRFFLGDVDMDEVWGLHLTPPLDVLNRLPMLRRNVTIAPQVHPAHGFHQPQAASQCLVGFDMLTGVVAGETPARGLYDDPYLWPNYRELLTVEEFEEWADDYAAVIEVSADTEGYTHAPWSLQLSKRPGEAVLVRKLEVVAAVARWFAEAKPTLIGHSTLHDVAVLREMGIDAIELGIELEDTQLLAYLLNVLPQGLKPLATRECGMMMQGYREVLGDAQDRHARAYLGALWAGVNTAYQALCEEDFRFQTTVAKRRIKKVPKLPKTQLHKAVERVLGSKEPARLWGEQVIDLQVEAHSRLGAMPEASLSDVEPEVALRYAARDPDATGRVREALMPRVRKLGLEPVYRLDLGTYPILDRMMQVGIAPDPRAFGELATILDGELSEIRHKLRTVTGIETFNANSGDQTAAYLYDTLGLEPLGKQLAGGRGSTDDKVLEALMRAHPELPQIADIRSYREYYKLRWTFVERLPELVNKWPWDERIHCELMLTRTPSGRLASKNPNLLAMPKHGKFAKAFRRCFVAGPGRLLLSADESQVEMRGLAHLSQDPVMCAIYRGERRNPDGSLIDLHAVMAHRIFGVEPKLQDESKHRLPAKAVNFGLPMGMTCVGLCLELRKGGLDVTEDDAQRWIDEADALYVEVPRYKAHMIAEAERNGYVRCPSGRIRYIGGIRAKNDRVRAEAERFAFSTPIQESAQWVGKYVLANAWRDIFVPMRKAGHWCEPILWIHDDLLSEMEANLVLTVAPHLRDIMTSPPPGFTIPLATKPEAGLSWGEMVPV